MAAKKKWRIVVPIVALVLIFIAIMFMVGDQLSPVNKVSIVVVGVVVIYFIYLASSLKS